MAAGKKGPDKDCILFCLKVLFNRGKRLTVSQNVSKLSPTCAALLDQEAINLASFLDNFNGCLKPAAKFR